MFPKSSFKPNAIDKVQRKYQMRAPVAAIVAELFSATKIADLHDGTVASGFCRGGGHGRKVSGQRDTLVKITVKRF
jgi:hypothetical protein